MTTTVLAPLPYHRYVATRLETAEPALWQACDAFGRTPVDPGADNELSRRALPIEVHAAVDAATAALRLDGVPEARLPDAVVAAIGARGAPDVVLRARAGRAVARQMLWILDDGRFGTADRLLRTLTLDTGTPMTYLETARRFALATDLHGDRAAAVACGDLTTAVQSIGGAAAAGRTAALAHWYAHGGALPASGFGVSGFGLGGPGTTDPEEAARGLLSSGLDVDRLDVLDRERLERVTRTLVEDVLADPRMRTERVLALARGYFPDLAMPGTAGADLSSAATTRPPTPVPSDATPLTRRYLAYVALDLATADTGEAGIASVREVAAGAGIGAEFSAVSVAELALR